MNFQYEKESPSYFWKCITLDDDCPFFSITDPRLFYFGVGLMTIYAIFLLTVLLDINFYWTLDNFQQRISLCINYVKKKLRHVEIDQRRLLTIQERTEKQTRKSEECKKIVTALRGALLTDDPYQMETLTGTATNSVEDYDNLEPTD